MKSGRRLGRKQKKEKTEGATGLSRITREQINIKMESNDSPEIPDSEETSETPGLPWGLKEPGGV